MIFDGADTSTAAIDVGRRVNAGIGSPVRSVVVRGDCICMRRVSKCSMSVLAEGGRKLFTAGIAGRKGGSADAMPSNSASVRTARKVGAVPKGGDRIATIACELLCPDM
jgi:hypothetical protein